MTLSWHQITTLAAFEVIFFLSLLPGLLSLHLTQSGEPKRILVTNKPFEFQCTAKGTPSELANIKIIWEGLNSKGKDIIITGGDDYGNIAVKKETGSVTSILKVQKPPDFPPDEPPAIKYYKCEIEGKGQQHQFSVYIVEEKAVPKIHPIQPNQARHKEKVNLTCNASYENGNFKIAEKFDVILSWRKDDKILARKTVDYKHGNHTVILEYSLTVNSFKDGGDYVCDSQLTLKDEPPDFVHDDERTELQIFPFRNGPNEKEVKKNAGSNVELYCDITGYPITYQWRDEENCVIGVDKRCTNSRIRQNENILYINDIDYKDRKKYTCVGSFGGNSTLSQIIILRVKDPLAPLWPFIGILVEAVLVAAIILASEYYKKHNQRKKDGANTKTETVEQPTTSHTEKA